MCGRENWAVMFDRLFIKFFMMIWPLCGIFSYAEDNFLNIIEVAGFALYMTLVSFLLVMYEIYTCVFNENQNPQYIF